MKRIFLLKGLDCPNCSVKIEKEVGELDGVQDVYKRQGLTCGEDDCFPDFDRL